MTTDRTRSIVEAAERLEQHLHDVAESRTVGRNASLADVVYAVEHGGALDGALARENVRQLLLAIALPASPPVPEAKLRAVYDAAERLAKAVDLGQDGSWCIETVCHEGPAVEKVRSAFAELGRAIALPAEPMQPASIRSDLQFLATYRARVAEREGIDFLDSDDERRRIDRAEAWIKSLALPAEPAPAWTSTPPTADGHYWIRGFGAYGVARVLGGYAMFPGLTRRYDLDALSVEHEFWPVRLQEPPA